MDMNSTVTSNETSCKWTLFPPFSVFASHSANCCISANTPSFKGVDMCSLCLLTFQTSTCFRLETASSGWSRDFEEGAYWRSDLQRLIFSSLDSNKTLNLASTLAIKGVAFSLNISGSQSCYIFKNSCFVFN